MEKQTQGRIWYKLRGALIAPAYLFTFFCTWRETEHWAIFIIGTAVFTAGFLLRVWSQIHLHYRLKVHKTLTTTGPYAIVRNPIYIGNTLILVGTTLLAELAWFAPIMLLTCMITYSLVARYEERHLGEKYGTPYHEYLARVPRWAPFLVTGKYQASRDHMRFVLPSILAELHIMLLLLLPLAKELISELHQTS